jgi:hypothetical protein
MAEAALVLAPLDVLEHEVQEALALCGGDPMKALRITLIANAFLEAQIDHLSAGRNSNRLVGTKGRRAITRAPRFH